MPKVYIYHSLKRHKIQEQALGHLAKVVDSEAILPGYSERMIGTWPTASAHASKDLEGEIISVSNEGLDKLDKWEDRYKRVKVWPDNGVHGMCWMYVLEKYPWNSPVFIKT